MKKLYIPLVLLIFVFQSCQTLEGVSINLSNKNLINTSKVKIKNIQSVKEVNLNENNLTAFPEFIFSATSLEKLHLSGNKINSIPSEISKLKELRILDISSNPITHISPKVDQLKKLKYIHLIGDYDKKMINLFKKSFCKNVKIIIYSELENPYGSKNCDTK